MPHTPEDIDAIAAYARNICGSNDGARRAMLKAYLALGGETIAESLYIIEVSDPADLYSAWDDLAKEAWDEMDRCE